MATEGLEPIALDKFGGLRLDLDPLEAGTNAVDILNVEHNATGTAIRTRPGYTTILTFTSSDPICSCCWTTGGNVLIGVPTAAGVNKYAMYDPDGGLVTTLSSGGGFSFSSCSLNTPTVSRTYFADGLHVGYATAGALAFLYTSPNVNACHYVATTSDNRLAMCRTVGFPSRVRFSDPGDPATVGANNFVDLDPGDGEAIAGALNYQGDLYVFKQTKFYVFYGNSTDGNGNPVFNYRPVKLGVGSVGGSQDTIQDKFSPCVGPDGVYFTNGLRVFRTTGGSPQVISEPIEPYLAWRPQGLFAAPTLALKTDNLGYVSYPFNFFRMRYADRKIFLIMNSTSFAVGSNVQNFDNGVFVYQIDTQLWTYWDIPVIDIIPRLETTSLSASTASDPDKVFWGLTADHPSGAVGKFVRFQRSLSADQGVAITSRFRSGFSDLGTPGKEKVIRQTELIGSGTVTNAWAREEGATPTGSAVTLGTAPALARGLNRVSQQGENLSYTLSGVAPWAVNRVTPFVRSVRGGGERSS